MPEDVSFDRPGNPLDHHPTWKYVACPRCGGPAQRETDTFDTFFEIVVVLSRFCSARSPAAFDREAVDYWMPVDQYIEKSGGWRPGGLFAFYLPFKQKDGQNFERSLLDELP